MAEIRVLPRHLVNKIAAGEVIERPASVVKELVENALDAGAAHIDVAVEDGGRKMIRVRDDGVGMTAEDLALAFAPHATSKIAEEEDLFNIATMGFRGEALASIAAVSHAHIRTRPRTSREGEGGYEVRADGERITPVRPAAQARAGTTVTVRDLFFNTPARRKFLRTAATEFGHVVEQVVRLALAHRRVGFTIAHNGRTTHRLEATDSLRTRIGDCFGSELAEALIEFAAEEGNGGVFGLIAPPAQARASGRWQYFFVNGRYVRDRFLGHALREAYRGLMDPSRYPVAFVFLRIDPGQVDVNVHPTKIEVRFRDARLVHSQVLASLREALNKANLAARVEIPAGVEPPEEAPEDERRRSLKRALAEFFKSAPRPQPRLDFPRPAPPAAPIPPRQRSAPARMPAHPPPPAPAADEPARPAGAELRPTAIQIHDSYIVTATDEGLAIIDQHALHERILFEQLQRRMARGALEGQRLLIPQTVSVTGPEKAALMQRCDLLERLGVEVSEFGPTTVAVHRFPSLLAERNVPAEEFLRDLLELLVGPGAGQAEELLSQALASIACKAAIKAGDRLSPEEIDALLARGAELERGSACPHGRPTTLTLSLADLDKQFKRT